MLKVVLDTNAILRTVSSRSEFSDVLDKLKDGFFELWVSNEIVLEYEEKITEIFSTETAELLLSVLNLLPNVKKTEIHFYLELIDNDPDDNKFVDCAFAGNVHYLVSNDKHFNRLKTIDFPSINILTLEEFHKILQTE